MTKSPFDVDFLRVDFEKSNFFGECMLKKVGKIMGPRAKLSCRENVGLKLSSRRKRYKKSEPNRG